MIGDTGAIGAESAIHTPTESAGSTTDPVAAAVATLPPLRDVVRHYGLAARKSLGQHFLLDLNLTSRIARNSGGGLAGHDGLSGINVLEIGPGPGGLTRALLLAGAERVVAVERDPRCLKALAPLVTVAAGRLQVVQADALTVDATDVVPAPRVVVANLPYNIATPLLIGWLRQAKAFRSLTLMFQAEVADRLSAEPGTKAYGRLSVVTQWQCRVERLLRLPAKAFTPPPKVASAVVRLTPRTAPEPADWATMERVTAAAFQQRRKMLRQSLKSLGTVDGLLDTAGLDGTCRAEMIPVSGFAALAQALAKSNSKEIE